MRAVVSLLVAACALGCSPTDNGSPDSGTSTTIPCDGGTISLSVSGPSCLWAPNHQMVLFDLSDVTVQTTGTCSVPTLSIVGVTSNEPATGGGQGNFAPDYTFNSGAVCLRSERQGTGSDRIYSITIQATDGTSTVDEIVTITVPHDQGGDKCPAVASSRIVADDDPRCAP